MTDQSFYTPERDDKAWGARPDGTLGRASRCGASRATGDFSPRQVVVPKWRVMSGGQIAAWTVEQTEHTAALLGVANARDGVCTTHVPVELRSSYLRSLFAHGGSMATSGLRRHNAWFPPEFRETAPRGRD